MKKITHFFLAFTVLGLLFTSCDTDSNQNTSSFSINLVDAPGDYDKVNVEVTGVEVIINDEIVNVDMEAGVYDLLELTGGVSALLAEGEFPSGELSQMRLILGNSNNLVIDGVEHSLQTPSGQETGLKLNIDKKLEPGIRYEFILDFNVDKSVVVLGNNSGYVLKPVIRATTVAESGAISGLIEPTTTESLVVATNGTDEISAYTNENGAFLLYGVPEGTYTITVTPAEGSNLSSTTVENVEVTKGETTTLETITLETAS